MKIDLYTTDGSKKGSITLPKEIFEADIAIGLMHDALLRQQGNGRVSTASAKTRSEVAGGGRKPWKQKGTGRARQGSIRSAQWRGGGIIFGPTPNRNFGKEMPKKMRRKALLGALSAKAKAKGISALEGFSAKEPKTKDFSQLLQKIGCTGKTLVVTAGRDTILEKSANNIQEVKTIFAQYLNIADILSADRILFLEDAIEKTKEIFGSKK